ncbi:MAG: hypothetical protein HFJ65_00510 [Eggerthellaceae bacterium]|nr:hypothetical protein [Eggerthellaceae bacterium]
MRNLSSSLDSLVTDLIPDADSALKVRSNNSAYVAAVREVWSSEVAARLVLDHTNAFYVRKDETPRKGPDKDKPYIVCEVCLDEPLIRSEMDARREMVSLALMKQGLRFDELRIIPARRGMRKRHPFADA